MKRFVVLWAAASAVSAVQAADLLDVYRDAWASDAKIASAKAALDAGREKAPQAYAGLLPSVNLNASSTYNDLNVSQPVDRRVGYNTNSYTLQLTQPLFRMQNWVLAKEGDIQVATAEAQYVAAKMDLMVRVSQAYFDLLYAQDVLSSVQLLKSASSEQLEIAKKSFEVGTVTVTDVNDAQSRFDLAAAQEIAAQNDVSVKREALRVLISKEPPNIARLRTGVTINPPDPANIDQWVSAVERGNIDVQVQNLSVDLASREVERARAGHLPTVDAVASYGRSHAEGSASGSPSEYKSWAIGVQVTVPLYQGGGTQSKVRETFALLDKARADLDYTKRSATQAARQYYLGVTNGIAQVKGYEAALVSSQSSLDSNKLGYQVGVRINIDVLNAQSQLATTVQNLSKARYDTVMAQIRLKQAAGSLSETDLNQVNGLLEH